MLRLCLGRFNGRKLDLPPSSFTRPASQKVRHAVYNILQHRYSLNIEGSFVLDVFAGSGAMGLEALSLGAKHVCFFEKEAIVVKCLHNNIRKLQLNECIIDVMRVDLLGSLKSNQSSVPASLCFIDPPYKIFECIEQVARNLEAAGFISDNTLLCCEGPKGKQLPDSYFRTDDIRLFGQTHIHFSYLKSDSSAT